MDAAAAMVVGSFSSTTRSLPLAMAPTRPLSPSPLWFPALQDEYFSAPTGPADHDESSSYSSSLSSSYRSDARWTSSSTSRTAPAAAAAAPATATDVDLSSSLSSSSEAGATAAGAPSDARVEIVGMPLLLDRHDDGAVKTGGKNNEEDDPKGLILLGRCHSHDTMTTTASTAASTTCTAAGVLDAAVDGAGGLVVPSAGPTIMARATSDNVIQHESYAAHHRRRSGRDSRRALSAQDWDSILGRVVQSGDDTVIDRAGDGTVRAKEGAVA